jgi:hypothetical protein
VHISSLSSTNDSDNNLSFAFGSFTHGHVTYDDKGGVVDSNAEGWDFTTGTGIPDAPLPHPDVDLL